jgi:hypothetical protein
MDVLIIPASFGLLCLALPIVSDGRERLLLSAAITAAYIALTTELLSLLHKLNHDSIGLIWLIALLVLIIAVAYRQIKGSLSLARPVLPGLSKVEWCCLATLSLILIGTGLQAYFSPSNTWDSMCYHMTRVVYWAQSGSLDFYPTMNQRQLHYQPGAEFAILHLQLLAGCDRFANFVQWSCFSGSLVGISLVARELGLDRKLQIFAATIYATAPQVVLQISSTQNDVCEALWLVGLMFYLLLLKRSQGRRTYSCCLQFALCLALAVLTKGIAYMVALPICIWFAVVAWRRLGWRFLALAVPMALIVLLINGGHFWRCFAFYGSPFGTQLEMAPNWKATNDYLTAATLFSNSVRSLATDFATPFLPINLGLNVGAVVLLTLLGIDANDPHTTWWTSNFVIETKPFNEIVTGSPIHLILFLATLWLCFFNRKVRNNLLVSYAGCIVSGFLLLNLLIRFQPWGGRYHLGWYGLCAPLAVLCLSRLTPRLTEIVVLGLSILSIPYILCNDLRPLVGANNIFLVPRERQYFYGAQRLAPQYLKAVTLIREQAGKNVGVSTSWNCWEYPLWALLNPTGHEYNIKSVEVINGTQRLPDPFSARPTIMLEILHQEVPKMHDQAFRKRWRKIWNEETLSL